MLVCNISMRPRRLPIAVTVLEVGAATDESLGGQIIFATLVDDPASVRDEVDAYYGDIMLEAASANDVVNAGFAATAAIDEILTATDSVTGTSASFSTRSAMLGPLPVFVNPGTIRQANARGVMINL